MDTERPRTFDDFDRDNRAVDAFLYAQRRRRELEQERKRYAVQESDDVLAAVHLPSGISWLCVPNDRVEKVARQLGALTKAERAQPVQHQDAEGVVDLSPVALKRWTDWANGLIRAAFKKHNASLDAQLDALCDQIASHVVPLEKQVKELRSEIGTLRADLSLAQSILRGEVATLKQTGKIDAA